MLHSWNFVIWRPELLKLINIVTMLNNHLLYIYLTLFLCRRHQYQKILKKMAKVVRSLWLMLVAIFMISIGIISILLFIHRIFLVSSLLLLWHGCDQMKTLNIVQIQNYDLDHWKMSTDHKKTSTRKCQ